MKNINPQCPRNQGVTPIANGGTGENNAEAALAALGGAKAEDLKPIMGPWSTQEPTWWPIFKMAGGGAAFMIISACKDIKNIKVEIGQNGWKACTVMSQVRNAGDVMVIIETPSDVTLEEGKIYLGRISFAV